jgi:hypothetical protein
MRHHGIGIEADYQCAIRTGNTNSRAGTIKTGTDVKF